jgi:hypothetical protein
VVVLGEIVLVAVMGRTFEEPSKTWWTLSHTIRTA